MNEEVYGSENSVFNPSEFFIPGWKGEGLITASAIVIKNSLSNLLIDAISLFKKSCSSSKSMKLQTFNEFLHFAEYANVDKSLVSQQNDFWLHFQDESSPIKQQIDEFIKIHCFRAVSIYLFRIKFIMDLSKEQGLIVTEDILLNPLSFLGRIFKKDSSTELFCESLQINQFSWYRPSSEYKESLLKLKDAFLNVTLTELIKLISTPKDDQIYSIKNYSHSLSHLSFGLLVNELLVKFPSWINPSRKPKVTNTQKICLLPKTINTRFVGNNISSFALSHWLAQECNIKVSQWNNLICPEFEGLEFIDGQFLKICQELQFLSFLTKVVVEHKYEIIPFICKVMREKYHNSPDEVREHQSSFLNLGNISATETLYNRIVLNITELPKSNPHHYLIQQIQAQKNQLAKDGMIFVFSNQKLFVPSHSDRVEQLLKDFKVEASFNFEDLKGKGEIAHFIYVLSKRTSLNTHNKHLFEANKQQKEICLSFEFKGSLSRFNKFNKLVLELQHFTQHKNAITTPIYINELEPDINFEYHQDAIVQGKLVSSASTKESGHLPHPSFFKNLTKSCTSLDTFFHIDLISQDDHVTSSNKNLASELLGLKLGPEKQFPLLLIVNQTNPMDVRVELTTTDGYRAKVEQYGTAFYHYFGLVPKNQIINLNVFREFFISTLGHQIIQMQLSDGPAKLKAKLKSLLVPSFFGQTQMMPTEVKNQFIMLDLDAVDLKTQHPDDLQLKFDHIKLNFEKYSENYPWHLLGLLSHFKLQLLSTLEDFEINKTSSIKFENPLLSKALVKLKTYSIYPNNSDIYINYQIKTHQELQLPLSSTHLKSEGDDSILVLKFQDKDVIHLHSSPTMNNFIKFILQNANGAKIADILLNLKVPNMKELEDVTSNVEKIKASKSLLLNETEELISNILRTQISK